MHRSDIVDADGAPMRTLPEALQANASFTKVSWQDPNIFQKIFVKQFPHGTGGFASSLDSFSDFKQFMLHAIHSLDGEFLDDKDGGEFLFFAYEVNLKRKLYRDYVGKHIRQEGQQTAGNSRQEIYSHERYSHRLAELVPNSRESLYSWKQLVQHLCLPGNKGHPTSMTTTVSNAHASTIWAHVEKGALAPPNPEETLRYFTAEKTKRNINENVAVQTLDYRRRRREFQATAYSASQDALRGKVPDRITRSEDQQRGHRHSHTNEFAERCGCAYDQIVLEIPMVRSTEARKMNKDSKSAAATLTQGDGEQHSNALRCRSVSRWCLKSSAQCWLPEHCNGTPYHLHAHCAEATAEMVRPFPIGTVVESPPAVLDVQGKSLEATLEELSANFWTGRRLKTNQLDTTTCKGTFATRFLEVHKANKENTLGSPMNFRDLCVAFYYRFLQSRTMPHVCKLGYCRPSWDVACKFDLPATKVTETMFFDDEKRRTVPRKTHLDDDAYNKTTSLECLVDTLMNIQVNAHHPDGDAPMRLTH